MNANLAVLQNITVCTLSTGAHNLGLINPSGNLAFKGNYSRITQRVKTINSPRRGGGE